MSRVPLFYARPNVVPHTSVISVCLPKKRMSLLLLQYMRLRAGDIDILNQINPSGPRPKEGPERSTDPGPHPRLEDARHFVKFVFPRQYGFSNPFITTAGNTVPFYDREIEAAISVRGRVLHNCDCIGGLLPTQARGFMRTPKRINSALGLFEKLIWRHGKCGYKPLLNTACPSKVRVNTPKKTRNLCAWNSDQGQRAESRYPREF